MPNYSGVWTLSQQFQGRGQGLWPATPGAPTIGTAVGTGIGIASIAFTAPACTGVPAGITGYIARSTPGCFTATGSSSPITISGLSSTTSYTFAVAAQNATGYGAYSAQSNSVTPNAVVGQTAYTAPGTYTWAKPSGVTNVSIVAVGSGSSGAASYYTGEIGVCWCGYGGGGGGGGALAYLNNYDVSARSSLQIVIAGGGNSTVNTCAGALIFRAGYGGPGSGNSGGAGGVATGTFTASYAGGAGGTGGYSACNFNNSGGGGAGAAGYAGAGGTGVGGVGGSGGSGGGGNINTGGGGVGILGQGANGAPNGGGGSGGSNASSYSGGAYGGGGSGNAPGPGGGGAVRIIYPGSTRSFPSTCTGNL